LPDAPLTNARFAGGLPADFAPSPALILRRPGESNENRTDSGQPEVRPPFREPFPHTRFAGRFAF
jgi:hypothetical protein